MATVNVLMAGVTRTREVEALLEDVRAGTDVRYLAPGEDLGPALADVEVLYGRLNENEFRRASRLRWVQCCSTGVDDMLYPAFVWSQAILTGMGGALTITVAEHAMALLMALTRNLHLQRDLQHERCWKVLPGAVLDGMALGILGLGRIGRAVAERAAAFGMTVDAVDAIAQERPACVRSLEGLDALPALLERSQALVVALPLTPRTRGLIDRAALRRMPQGSYLVNISRGRIVDETALVESIREGRLAGAGIDVTEQEPCPPDSPLWGEPRVLLTPHSAGHSVDLQQRKIGWFARNLKRYLRNEPLLGMVDKRRGW